MAQDGERSAPADKGKGKVDDVKDLAGGKKAQTGEKPQADGKKKDEEPQEGRRYIEPVAWAGTSRPDAASSTSYASLLWQC